MLLAFLPLLLAVLAACCWGPQGQSAASGLVSRALSHARAEPPRRVAAARGKAMLKGQLAPRAANAETPAEPPAAARAHADEAPAATPASTQAQAGAPVATPASTTAQGETPPAEEPEEPPLPPSHASPGAVERVSLGGGAFLLVPPGLDPADGPYDLIVHFHGVAPPLERALGASGLRAVVVDVNVGAGSGPYATIVREGVVSLDRVITKIERTMARRSPGFASVPVGRVALSAWSAGYGSVLRLLSSPKTAERVDAVLLADCPHAGFRDVARRQVDGAGLEPLLAFGRRAMRGEALLAITHSDIETVGYASTHETTDFLLRALGLSRRRSHLPGPGRMVRTSFAEAGGFSLSGYQGVDAAAHGDHLRNLDATLFPRLRRRWTPAPAPAAPAEQPVAARAPEGPSSKGELGPAGRARRACGARTSPAARSASEGEEDGADEAERGQQVVEREPFARPERGEAGKDGEGDDLLDDLELDERKAPVAEPVRGHRQAVLEERDAPAHEHRGPEGAGLLGFEVPVPREGHEDVRHDE
ncbi:MAG TPA: hypothetical protein VFS43_38780 [Polyangiaceae bacterium]|nr:hypothetical protein [Polyangiaceae bacterium]